MWFQNRRAKFRRNERSLSIQNTSPAATASAKILTKCHAPLTNRTEAVGAEKNVFSASPLTTSDIQYVMPWKYPAHYSQQEIYTNTSAISGHLATQSCSFLPGGPYNYFPNNISAGGLCNRMDVNGISRYRQDFNLTPQI